MNKIVLIVFLIILSSCFHTKTIAISNSPELPAPIGPYSHATSYGDLIFISGQIGIDPTTNLLKQGVEEQTIQIFENLKMTLEGNNSNLNHVLKTTIFVTDMKQFELINTIYGSYFKNQYPARSTIEIVSLPKNASIEIECIAIKKRD